MGITEVVVRIEMRIVRQEFIKIRRSQCVACLLMIEDIEDHTLVRDQIHELSHLVRHLRQDHIVLLDRILVQDQIRVRERIQIHDQNHMVIKALQEVIRLHEATLEERNQEEVLLLQDRTVRDQVGVVVHHVHQDLLQEDIKK